MDDATEVVYCCIHHVCADLGKVCSGAGYDGTLQQSGSLQYLAWPVSGFRSLLNGPVCKALPGFSGSSIFLVLEVSEDGHAECLRDFQHDGLEVADLALQFCQQSGYYG